MWTVSSVPLYFRTATVSDWFLQLSEEVKDPKYQNRKTFHEPTEPLVVSYRDVCMSARIATAQSTWLDKEFIL